MREARSCGYEAADHPDSPQHVSQVFCHNMHCSTSREQLYDLDGAILIDAQTNEIVGRLRVAFEA